jgi:DNA mismatch endonuclease (patch repair protein)
MPRSWRAEAPDPAAWRPAPGLSRVQRREEQDRAAGGREIRRIPLESGRTATASVALRHNPRSRRVYAYLRWFDGGRTRERFIAEATAPTRAEALVAAWIAVRERGLVQTDPTFTTPPTRSQ